MERFLSASTKIIEERLGNFKLPFYIGWTLTYRCNQRCLYCMVWKKKVRELTTEEILSIIKELAAMGTAVICFTGGEVLLRNDIGRIIDYAHKRNINVDMNTNGFLIKERLPQIKYVRIFTLSLDGPEKIQDTLRGKGSYKRVLEAVGIAKQNKIRVYLRTVLSSLNSKHIDFVLTVANKFKVGVIFQPSTPLIYGTNLKNPFMPSDFQYREAIDNLIIEKARGNKYIFNSLPVLRYLRDWPKTRKIFCTSGKIMFGIKPDGMLYPCTWGRDLKTVTGKNCLALGVKEAIKTLPASYCDRCGNTSSLEFNYRLANLLNQTPLLINSKYYFGE